VRRTAAVTVAIAALLAAGLAHRAGLLAEGEVFEQQAHHQAQAAGREAAEALQHAHQQLQLRAVAAAALPQLGNQLALDEKLAPADAEDRALALATLRDLLTDAPYVTFTRAFPVYGILTGRFDELVVGLDRSSLHIDALLAETRLHGPSSAVLITGETLWLGALAPVAALPSSSGGPAPLLLLAEPLDARRLEPIATRVGGSVLLTDGRRPLVEAGPVAARAQLRTAVGREGSREVVDPSGEWAAGAAEVAPGLWLWSSVDTRPLSLASQQQLRTRAATSWIVGAIVAALALVLGLRRPSPPAPAPLAMTPTSPGLDHTQVSLRVNTDPALAPPAPVPLTITVPEQATVFGRYVLVDRLASGGMGEVFLAVAFGAEGFRRNFVIKRLRAELANQQLLVAQFIDEARLSSSLVHSNIIPVFDFGKVGDEYYMAQEYISGRDLERLTARALELGRGPLPAHLLTHVAHQVLQALQFAHGKLDDAGRPLGLVHRDISPQNIMISARGEVKLFDFGIVKATARASQTEVGVVKGNVSFMAPEQARGQPLDQRADLFSLGLVLYRCLVGELLYRENSAFELLVHAANGPSVADREKLDALPLGLGAILGRALSADPAERFPDALTFAAALPAIRPGDASELAAIVLDLFGPELEGERKKLASMAAPRATHREGA
jgi:tRNA A-37 threonylcarbamoyl transferase component Bud32